MSEFIPNQTRVHYSQGEIQEDGLVLDVLPEAGLVRVRFDGYSPSDEVGIEYLTIIE